MGGLPVNGVHEGSKLLRSRNKAHNRPMQPPRRLTTQRVTCNSRGRRQRAQNIRQLGETGVTRRNRSRKGVVRQRELTANNSDDNLRRMSRRVPIQVKQTQQQGRLPQLRQHRQGIRQAAVELVGRHIKLPVATFASSNIRGQSGGHRTVAGNVVRMVGTRAGA